MLVNAESHAAPRLRCPPGPGLLRRPFAPPACAHTRLLAAPDGPPAHPPHQTVPPRRCPKNTLVRKVLGGLKDRAEPVDLPVYPVKLQGGKVFVKFI